MKGARVISLRKIARWVLPPFVADLTRTVRSVFSGKVDHEYEYVSQGWTEIVKGRPVKGWNVGTVAKAQQASFCQMQSMCSEPHPLDHSNEAAYKGRPDLRYHNNVMCFAYVLACVAREKTRISILDWGGGSGTYYLVARSLFPWLHIDYTCKELPETCALGRSVNPDVTFISDEAAALGGRFDLVFASASIHYSKNWEDVLTRLLSCSISYTYITRLPVLETVPSYTMIQRPGSYGYDTEYLGWCVNRGEFLRRAEAAGVRLKREFLCGDADQVVVAGAPEQAWYRGFLFEKTDSVPRER